MKKITKISKQQKGNRYNLFVDDVYLCSVTEDTLVNLKLKKGTQLDETVLKHITIEEQYNKCYNDALFLLGQRNYFEKALSDKLKQKGYENEPIEKTIEKLKSYRYLDNTHLTETFVRDKKQLSKKGPRAIANALYAKGVDADTIKNALEENYDSEEELENCKCLLDKKLDYYRKRCSDKRLLKGKLYAFLAQRGYHTAIIKKAIEDRLE